MGEYAIRDLHRFSPFDEIRVAVRDPDRARHKLRDVVGTGPRLSFERADARDEAGLRGVLADCDAAVNCFGPNYRWELPVARAAIAARVPLVDINDEFETTLAMYDLDAAAREAGITVVMGLGASPGVNNVLVRAAADQLDEVHEIRTAWVMTAADPGGLALACHLLYSLSGRALTVEDGTLREVRSLVDGRERVAFPDPVGEVDVFHAGHPEPLTLQRSFPEARRIDDKATFLPASINDWILSLGRLVRERDGPICVDGKAVDVMDFAAGYLWRTCRNTSGAPAEGALRVTVSGRRGGKPRRVCFSSKGLLGHGTGLPAAVGAAMLAEGKIAKKGVLAPEACIDPTDFLYEMFQRRDVAKLNGWVEE
jgi:saccharopine dehydrogenase-like NADP-dependent oxidoreductase